MKIATENSCYDFVEPHQSFCIHQSKCKINPIVTASTYVYKFGANTFHEKKELEEVWNIMKGCSYFGWTQYPDMLDGLK